MRKISHRHVGLMFPWRSKAFAWQFFFAVKITFQMSISNFHWISSMHDFLKWILRCFLVLTFTWSWMQVKNLLSILFWFWDHRFEGTLKNQYSTSVQWSLHCLTKLSRCHLCWLVKEKKLSVLFVVIRCERIVCIEWKLLGGYKNCHNDAIMVILNLSPSPYEKQIAFSDL